MEALLTDENAGQTISTLLKKDLIVILQSAGLNHLGKVAELKSRLLDYINERRAFQDRDETIFEESSDSEDGNSNGDLLNPTVSRSELNNTANLSLDSAIREFISQGNSLTSENLDSAMQAIMSKVQVSENQVTNLVQTSSANSLPVSQANSTSTVSTSSLSTPISSTSQFSSMSTPITARQNDLNQRRNYQFHPNILQQIQNTDQTISNFSRQQLDSNFPLAIQNQSSASANDSNLNIMPQQIPYLFTQFLNFLQNSQNVENSTIPQNSVTQNTAIPQNNSNNLTFQIPPQSIPQCFPQNPNLSQQNFPQFQTVPEPNFVNPKRMSYISSALEKRKIFFTGKQGSDPIRFIEYLKECATTMAITDGEIYNSLPVVLHGEALDWFRLNKINFPTLEEFSKALISQFSVKNYQERLMHEAYARQQGKNEPITTFLINIRLIFNQMDPKLPLSRQLDIACNNLNPNFIPYIRRSHINSFDDLTNEGKEIELNLEKMKNYKGAPNPSTSLIKNAAWPKRSNIKSEPKNSPNKDEISAIKSSSDSAKKITKKDQNSAEKPVVKTESSNNTHLADMPNADECYECRQLGHNFKDCQNEAKYRIFCFSCGKGKVTVPKCPNCKGRPKKNE